MKTLIRQWFGGNKIESTGEKLNNLRELRATKHANGVRIYNDLVADVLAAKAEVFNHVEDEDFNDNYRPRVLSVKTTYPC